MEDTQTSYSQEVRDKIKFINKNLIQEDGKISIMLGGTKSATPSQNIPSTGIQVFCNDLLKGYFTGFSSLTEQLTSTFQAPKIRIGQNNYITHNEDGLLTRYSGNNESIVVNMSHNLIGTSSFLSNMNNLHTLYTLFDKINYEYYDKFINGSITSITLKKYSISSEINESVVYNTTDSTLNLNALKDLVSNLLTDKLYSVSQIDKITSDTDIVALRRLLRMYLILGNFMIASACVIKHSTDVAAKKALNTVYDELLLTNRLMIKDQERNNESIPDLENALNQRMKLFKTYGNSLNELNSNVQTLKTNMVTNVDRVNKNKVRHSVSKKIWFVSFVIFTIITVGCIIAFSLKEGPQKQMIALGTLVTAFVCGMIVYIIQDKLLEPFAGSLVSSIDTYKGTISATDIANYIRLMNITLFDGLAVYLENTIRISLILNTYKNYGNINKSMHKEYKQYTNIRDEMQKGVFELASKNELINLEKSNMKAHIILFIVLMAIISTATYSVNIVPSSTNVVIIIATICTILSIAVFTLTTERRVRTKPNTIYWSKPNNIFVS